MPDLAALEPTDILAIHQLLALYGHLLDDGEYDRLGEVFTEDAGLEFAGRDREPLHTIGDISRFFATANGASAHHTSNIVLTPSGDEVRSRSKLFVPYTRPGHDAHRWYGGTYEDVVVRTPNGWRISHRTVTGRWQLTTNDDPVPAGRETF